jgi:hypothetical protein
LARIVFILQGCQEARYFGFSSAAPPVFFAGGFAVGGFLDGGDPTAQKKPRETARY